MGENASMPRALVLLALLLALLSPGASWGQAVEVPRVLLREGQVVVSFGLRPSEQFQRQLRKGISKELIIRVDLYRRWRGWPDEFILGKKLTRRLVCDPLKEQYILGQGGKDSHLKDCQEVLRRASVLQGLVLTSTKELPPGAYFVRVSVHSRLRRLPPLLGLLLFFLRQEELQGQADSPVFHLGGGP